MFFNRSRDSGGKGSGFIAKFDLDDLDKDLDDATVLITNNHVFRDESAVKKGRIKFHRQEEEVRLSKLLKDPLVFKSSPTDEVCSLFKYFHTQQQT